jgi:hypothetical protein
MLNLLVVALGAVVGFAGSRGLRVLTRRSRPVAAAPPPRAGSADAVARAQRQAPPAAPAGAPGGGPGPAPGGAPYPITINQPGRTAPAGPAPSTAMPGALVRSDTGERFELSGDRVTIGRAADRDITIDDNRVSRRHAEVRLVDDGWVALDLGSSNGTRVGKVRLEPSTPHRLAVGDVISVGPVQLRVVG